LFQESDATVVEVAIMWKERGVFSLSAGPLSNDSAARTALNRYRFPKQVVLEGVNQKKNLNDRVQFTVVIKNSFEVRKRDENILGRITKFYLNYSVIFQIPY